MYLNEAGDDKRLKEDLALCIEEVLRQRYQGVKNEQGVWITPAFPKLIYVLEDDNIREGAPYFYLTKLAAKCTAKRMVPDYISEKKMREYKLSPGETEGNGDVYTCMGCVTGDEVVAYKFGKELCVAPIADMWKDMPYYFRTKKQHPDHEDEYMDLDGISIWDNKLEKFVECQRIIRNDSQQTMELTFSNGRRLTCTPDHPFETENRGEVRADELTGEDVILMDTTSAFVKDEIQFNPKLARVLGLKFGSNCEPEEFDCNVNLFLDPKSNYISLGNIDVPVFKKWIHMLDEVEQDLIPADVFRFDYKSRLAFLAGLMDADGAMVDGKLSIFYGKALANELVILVQSLGMRAEVYRTKGGRYEVAFAPTKDMKEALVSADFAKIPYVEKTKKAHAEYCHLVGRRENKEMDETFDVTTESGHFMVSGLYSHNCRSFLTPDRSGNGWDNVAGALNYEPGKPKYYGRLTIR